MTGINFKRKIVLMPVLLIAGAALLSGSSAFAGFVWKSATSVQRDVTPMEASAQGSQSASSDGEILSGFGSDIPLLIAMQQVVPAGYNVSLGENVNPDLSVSWRGGKGWKVVLQDMVSSVGLGFHLEDHAVTVGNFSGDGKAVASLASVAPVIKQALPYGASNRVDMIPLDMIAAAKVPQEISVQPVPVPVPVKWEQAPTPVDHTPVNLAALPPALAVVPVSASVAMPVSAIAADLNPLLIGPSWLAVRGSTLREVLTDWTKRQGIELYWSIDYDYRLNDSATYSGNFEDAVSQLLERFEDTRPQPFGELHVGKSEPNVLVVSSYDLSH